MTRTVVVVENEKFDAAIACEVLESVAEVRTIAATTVPEIVAAAADADALIPWYVSLDAATLAELADLSVIGVAGTGVGGVDLAAAAEYDITVVNAPTYAADEVSTHAMALLLACVRSLPAYDRAIRAGEWSRAPGEPVHRLRGKTLGLLAFGDIARRMAAKAQGFGLEVHAYDPYVDTATMVERGVRPVDFDSLLGESDVLSVHAPLTSATTGLLDREAFAAMNPGCIVVNTGRGPVIEEAALIDALNDGTVAAAGLDVFEHEPLGESPLCDRDDVILTPHVGWYSEESREEVIRSVAEDVRRVFADEPPIGRVDLASEWHA